MINFEFKSMSDISNPLFKVFSKYEIYNNIDACACCISEEEIVALCSAVKKGLRKMEVNDFGRYPGKALTTWGGIEEFKFFLPRMLELEIYMKNYGFHWLTSKLTLEKYESWPEDERNALTTFWAEYFVFLIHSNRASDARELYEEINNIEPGFICDSDKSIELFQNKFDEPLHESWL